MDRHLDTEAIKRRLKKEKFVNAVYSSKKGTAGLPKVFINGVEVPDGEVADTLFNLLRRV